jgi:hypothetical protein
MQSAELLSHRLSHHLRSGTRFRLFPKAYEGYLEPETVWLSPLPRMIAPGPADGRMHVVDALEKEGPYDPPFWVPPYRGRVGPPALPSADGHFDQIAVDDRTFLSAHTYASARRVLDIWEGFLGRPIHWWHASAYPSLELIPLVHWNNAQSGGGFVEMGARLNNEGVLNLFCLNFEVIAHEIGHAILFSQVGVPDPDRLTPEYLAFQESFSDLIALISVGFFDSVVTRLLELTHGSLYILNLLNRIGEISQTEQIRIADNETRLRDLDGLHWDPASGVWTDETGAGRNAHDLAQPLTGAIFDIMVDIFQDHLAERGLIPPEADPRGWTREDAEAAIEWFDARWGAVFSRFEPEFRDAVIEARDTVGQIIALILRRADPNDLTFARIATLFLEASVELGQGHRIVAFRENFLDRDIMAETPAHASPLRLRAAARPAALLGSRAPCFSERVAASRRAQQLVRARHSERRTRERHTMRIDRLLRRQHREAGGIG